jgi:hypothetical protein
MDISAGVWLRGRHVGLVAVSVLVLGSGLAQAQGAATFEPLTLEGIAPRHRGVGRLGAVADTLVPGRRIALLHVEPGGGRHPRSVCGVP